MALPMLGRRDGLSRRSLLDFADRIGLPRPAAERVLGDVPVATAGVADALETEALGSPPQQLRPWVRALRNRRQAALPTPI